MKPFLLETLPPWEGPLPDLKGSLGISLILPVPVGDRSLMEPGQAAHYLGALHRTLQRSWRGRYEILLAPYGGRQPADGGLLSRLLSEAGGSRAFHWMPGLHREVGSAVRAAVFASRGRVILVGNLEYYYDPSFFKQALDLLHRDPSLTGVRANRRLPEAEFMVPVTLLSMVYRRHLLGLLLGRIWSRIFSLHSLDVLSGAYALRRRFALKAFNRITCPGFLYGAELALLAREKGVPMGEVPANFFMEAEKSRLRLWGEIAKVLHWTFRLWARARRGEYRSLEGKEIHLAADDWGLSPGVNEGILRLARIGLLRRVSVLSGGRHAAHKLKELKGIPGMEFGLHFNLTCPEAGGLFPTPFSFFRAWMVARILGRRRMVEKVRWILKDQFRDLRRLGIRPIRLDGHHHVHAVPGLLGAVEDILKEAGVRSVRAPFHRAGASPGRWIVAFLGWGLRRALRRRGFDPEAFDYPVPCDFFRVNRLIARLDRSQGAEVLVHPAARDDIAEAAPSDPLRGERVAEFRVLRLLGLEARLRDRKH